MIHDNADDELHMFQKEVLSVEHISNKDFQTLIDELKEEKMVLNLALENSKAKESRFALENIHLKVIIEVSHSCLSSMYVSIEYLL